MSALATQFAPAATPEASRLRQIGEALAAPREQIESTFVTVGARLAEGAAMLNRLTKVFEALPAQLQSPDLVEASTRLADVGRQAQTISALFATEQADLARLVDVVAAAEHPIGELRRTVKMMGIVAINARVVAAAIVGDSDDFDVFTTDIAKLSESASSTIQHFTAAYRQLTDEVGLAARQRSQFENAHADTLSGLAADMDTALAELARQRATSADSSAQTGRVSRQIVSRIANAVMALQVGDATRQRIEHVEAGLASLADLLSSSILQQNHQQSARNLAGCLQVAQLSAAAEAFENDVAEAGTALRDLATDARVIMDQSRAIYGQDDQGGASSLAALSDAVRHAALVLRDCEAERGKLESVATAVLGTVGTLLSHVEAVQEIEANMRLVSLNAAVKCAQLGPRGAALNVIARQLRELTGETVIAAEGAMAGLHEAAGLAQSFGAAANGDTAGRVGQLEHEATAALLLLQGVDTALAEALGALNRDGPSVIGLLETAAETFANQAAISETMRDLEMQLVAECPPGATDTPTGPVADLLAAHRARYTMDAERRIHEQMFGTEPAPAEPAVEPGEETDLDDLDALFL
ncbi:hypothetical protein JI749_16960 [Devosia oryziradicis]|uniref:Methyl-accepting transducer domain-containing protein n=1 Tax=Devosia oryziradicis TaxID=2801335 RepID=A0ABX7BY97_9HYPH|nr:hypothetical protein [Devosia oryziradicis]QQR35999.1 hypothetical protein JI749_16960 [Devosia oryziradicis]